VDGYIRVLSYLLPKIRWCLWGGGGSGVQDECWGWPRVWRRGGSSDRGSRRCRSGGWCSAAMAQPSACVHYQLSPVATMSGETEGSGYTHGGVAAADRPVCDKRIYTWKSGGHCRCSRSTSSYLQQCEIE